MGNEKKVCSKCGRKIEKGEHKFGICNKCINDGLIIGASGIFSGISLKLIINNLFGKKS